MNVTLKKNILSTSPFIPAKAIRVLYWNGERYPSQIIHSSAPLKVRQIYNWLHKTIKFDDYVFHHLDIWHSRFPWKVIPSGRGVCLDISDVAVYLIREITGYRCGRVLTSGFEYHGSQFFVHAFTWFAYGGQYFRLSPVPEDSTSQCGIYGAWSSLAELATDYLSLCEFTNLSFLPPVFTQGDSISSLFEQAKVFYKSSNVIL